MDKRELKPWMFHDKLLAAGFICEDEIVYASYIKEFSFDMGVCDSRTIRLWVGECDKFYDVALWMCPSQYAGCEIGSIHSPWHGLNLGHFRTMDELQDIIDFINRRFGAKTWEVEK